MDESVTALQEPSVATDEVVEFLSSLIPDLSHLASRVLDSGVHTAADLAGLAAMSACDLNNFLREEVHLNPFEAAVVRSGVIRTYATQY